MTMNRVRREKEKVFFAFSEITMPKIELGKSYYCYWHFRSEDSQMRAKI
jgi:hypothetical protein